MSVKIPEKFNDLIANAIYIWFTTVREDGMPQPTPVWFVRDGETFIIYTTSAAQKIKNLNANPKVALGIAHGDAGNFFVVQGEAVIDHSLPSPTKQAAYFAKYKDSLPEIGMTPEVFDQQFTLPIRVTPSHVRGMVE